ncbi:hypothetical protein K502DRAFT_324206 [Neoconidiobolus thromboides FSU 785]|nr:hypothetical protein K502DRAFT_324206 [Neoconidiobolus thromboides FSU 785]
MLNFASILFQVEEFDLKVTGLIAISLVAEYLNPNRLKKLKIQGFAINLFGLEILQKSFQNLGTLYLICTRFVVPYNFNKTKSFTNLKKLVLNGKFSRIFRLEYFGDLTNLTTLKVPFKKLATLDCISNKNHFEFQNLGLIDLKLIDGITVNSMSHLNKVYIRLNNELEDVILRLSKFKTVSTVVFYSNESDENESITAPYFCSRNETSNTINPSTTKLVFKECYLSIEVLFNVLRLFPNVTQVKFKHGQLTITNETCLNTMAYSTFFLIDYLAVNKSDIDILSKILPFSNFYLF